MNTAVLLIVTVGLLAGFGWWLGRPHTVIRLERGRAAVLRGRPPPGLLADLRAIAADDPRLDGRVELRGSGDRLEIETPGLGTSVEQRIRNVIHPHREKIRAV